MKILPVFLLIITTILVSTALAAPTLYMYSGNIDCRVCHNDANILRNTNHNSSHNGTEYSGTELHDDTEFYGAEKCLECHTGDVQMKIDCMTTPGCHNVDVGLENHHELEVESCFTCHEQGVPRGNL